ncbi:Protein hedgehog [Seminavis robusta]|uniref:Protein hedgehog n=1 Tax=Seminavis robusta TaxID=568900 RepID=A0A9N8EZC4_9STRA|nr:Protein hedgehog [Seminavis robusta]|eukprot:Sro2077_g313600.1 Protein hedgehog (412) ;mRNA; r:13572-14893
MLTRPKQLLTTFLVLSLLRKVDACSFSLDFASGTTLITAGLENFNVAPGASTTCVVSCASGSGATLYLKYGGYASVLDHDGQGFAATTCGVSTAIASSSEEYTLGWSLNVASAYTGLKLECSCTAAGDGDDRFLGGACFSSSATVQVLDKGSVPMKDVAVGDRVLTGENRYQPIYSFGHKEQATEQQFLQIHTDLGTAPVEMTADHLVFVVKGSGTQEAVRADSVRVGDRLATAAESSSLGHLVTKVSSIQKRGLYMPLTSDGTIVVDGIKTSSYVSIQDQSPTFVSLRAYVGNFSEQRIFHWWLSPLRMLCMGVSSKFCIPDDSRADQDILSWLQIGRKVLLFGDQQSFVVQVFALAAPIAVLFGFFNLVELVFGPALAPTMLAVIGTCMAWFVTRRRTGSRAEKKKKLA